MGFWDWATTGRENLLTPSTAIGGLGAVEQTLFPPAAAGPGGSVGTMRTYDPASSTGDQLYPSMGAANVALARQAYPPTEPWQTTETSYLPPPRQFLPAAKFDLSSSSNRERK